MPYPSRYTIYIYKIYCLKWKHHFHIHVCIITISYADWSLSCSIWQGVPLPQKKTLLKSEYLNISSQNCDTLDWKVIKDYSPYRCVIKLRSVFRQYYCAALITEAQCYRTSLQNECIYVMYACFSYMELICHIRKCLCFSKTFRAPNHLPISQL